MTSLNSINVLKRDGREVPFDPDKIVNAVLKAFKAVDGDISDYAKDKANKIAEYIKSKAEVTENTLLSIEDIQDMVEKGLSSTKRKDVAKAYIKYRYKRQAARIGSRAFMDSLSQKLKATNIQNQNANVDEASFGGRLGEATDTMTKQYAIDYCLSDTARTNHLGNMIYIHDLNHYVVGDHNCFHPDTEFITSAGIRKFSDYKNSDHITVLAPDGNWYPATVKYFGKQVLNKYTLKKNRTEKEIYATENHRWILSDGSVQEGLRLNDKLLDSPYYWNNFNFEDLSLLGKTYWCYGFVYGDGTVDYHYGSKHKDFSRTKVKLCGEKARFLNRFQQIGLGLKCASREPEITTIPYDKQIPNFSKLPVECLIAFIHGYYEADGTKALAANTGKPIYSIQATGEEACNFIERYFESAGLYINSVVDHTGEKTNFGIRKYTKNYEFFAQPSNKYSWYVKDIETGTELQDVWCLDVEEIHAFVLKGGIPTGNCMSVPFDSLLRTGFNTRQTDVRPANSINTAFQLVAVIFQLQSLQQFGGVSATHIDWTMVPYVRKSFYKHYIDGCKYIEGYKEIDIQFYPNESIDSPYYADGDSGAYQYAIDMTEKELKQAAEGLFHNLK